MSSDWETRTLAEVAIFENRLRIPLSATQRAERPGPYPYWGANGPFDTVNDYLFDGQRVLVAEDGNTVVRPDGRGAVHWAAGRYWVNNHAHVLSVQPGNNLRWLFYALSQAYVRDLVTGSAQPKLSMGSLKQLPLPVPLSDEQERIAAVLGTLDDKIESNGRLAATLEQLVMSAFRGRFIDFVGQALDGSLPSGWTRVTLDEIAVLHRDLVRGPSDTPYVGLDAMPRGSTVLTDWVTDGAPTGQAARFSSGDLLFGKLRPYFKKVGVAPIAGRCSTEILIVRPRSDEHYGLLLGHLASEEFIQHCVAVSSGTRMPRAEWKDSSTYTLALPPSNIAREFTSLTRTVYARIHRLIHESRILAETRDELLPKLISGEIRVAPDAHAEADEPAELAA